MFCNLLVCITKNGSNLLSSQRDSEYLGWETFKFKKQESKVFEEHREKRSYTAEFSLLDHLAENVSKSSVLNFLESFLFECFNGQVERPYCTASRREVSLVEESLHTLEIRRATLGSAEYVAIKQTFM